MSSACVVQHMLTKVIHACTIQAEIPSHLSQSSRRKESMYSQGKLFQVDIIKIYSLHVLFIPEPSIYIACLMWAVDLRYHFYMLSHKKYRDYLPCINLYHNIHDRAKTQPWNNKRYQLKFSTYSINIKHLLRLHWRSFLATRNTSHRIMQNIRQGIELQKDWLVH